MALQKSNPADMRKAVDVAAALASAGIEFVPVAVVDEQQKSLLVAMSIDALSELERLAGGADGDTAVSPAE